MAFDEHDQARGGLEEKWIHDGDEPKASERSIAGNASRLVSTREQAEAAWCGCLVNGAGQRKALRLYKKALLQEGSRDVDLLCSYANFALQHRGLPRAAAELALQQAIDIDPGSSEALCEYADMLLAFGGADEHPLALRFLDRIFTRAPGLDKPVEDPHGKRVAYVEARARYLYGCALLAGGDRQGGEAVLLDVAEQSCSAASRDPLLSPGAHLMGVSAASWGTLGLLALRSGEWSMAERRLQSALALGLDALLAVRCKSNQVGADSESGSSKASNASLFPRSLPELRLVVVVVRVLCRYGDMLAGVWSDMQAAIAMYEHAASLLPYASEVHVELAGLHIWTARGAKDAAGVDGSERAPSHGAADYEQEGKQQGRMTPGATGHQRSGGVVRGCGVLAEVVKRNGRACPGLVQHALLLSREVGMHDRAERLLQHAVDRCAPRSPSASAVARDHEARLEGSAPDVSNMPLQDAAEYALVLRHYFDFLLGIRGDLKQCAHVLTILASLHRVLGVELPAGDDRTCAVEPSVEEDRRGEAAGADGYTAREQRKLAGGERQAEMLLCQRRISCLYLLCCARFHWLLALRKDGKQGPGSGEGGLARGPGTGRWVLNGNSITRHSLLKAAESLLGSAYGVAVAGGRVLTKDSADREGLDLEMLAGEVMTCLGWVALDAGRYRDVEKYVVIALRRRGPMCGLRPVAVDRYEAQGPDL